MARKVFFSFHYQGDVGRVNQVRKSWLTKGETSSFLDAADWESIKKQGDQSIKQWINDQLDGTSVTIVLIGAETANSQWVKYEIEKSIKDKKGLLGIYIHNVKDFRNHKTTAQGENPFKQCIASNGQGARSFPKCYDWTNDNGYNNIEKWIEEAAQQAGR